MQAETREMHARRTRAIAVEMQAETRETHARRTRLHSFTRRSRFFDAFAACEVDQVEFACNAAMSEHYIGKTPCK